MKAPNNARVLIENMVSDEKDKRAPKMDIHKFFEFFVATQIMKDFGLNDDEILSGIPESNNERDGGIDGIYLFLNRKFVTSSAEPDFSNPITDLSLILTQCKYTDKVPEEIIHKFIIAIRDLFDLSNNIEIPPISDRYASEIIDTVQLFRDLYKASRSGVKITFSFFIAHLSGEEPVNLIEKNNLLIRAVSDNVIEAHTEISYLGPQELVALVRQEPAIEFPLEYKRDVISPDEKGFTCLVNLLEFYKFIHDDQTGTIRETIFEANVRDYQGENPVNEAIANSLATAQANIDFWWLNNGVTMVAEKVTRRGDGLIIQNPEIVNGLQTSHTIHHYYANNPSTSESRHILVRIIQLDEGGDQTRDQIIRATNSQTPIPPLLLHATESIHYDIEYHFRKCSPPLYYERRKSYYRNKGKRITEIIDMQTLAQSVVAILIRKPDDARARIRAFLSGRNSTGTSSKENYSLVFSINYPFDFYYYCASLRKRIEQFLKSDDFTTDPQKKSHAKYVLHHILMHTTIIATRNSEGPTIGEDGLRIYAEQVSRINPSSITDDKLKDSAERVIAIFENDKFQALPNAAKGGEMVQEIISAAKDQLRGSR